MRSSLRLALQALLFTLATVAATGALVAVGLNEYTPAATR